MSKKILPVIISIVIVICVTVGCVIWYKIATTPSEIQESGEKEVEDISNNMQKEEKGVSNEPIFTLDNYPKVDASLAIHPLVDSIASNFLGIDESELNFEYTKTRTSEVYHNLIDGKVDVIFAAEISKEDEAYAKQKNVNLEIIPATSSAFVFIVNKDNPVNNLTLEQVQDIYQGKITNWKEVGGDDAEIIPYQRPVGSGSQTAMISLVMKGKEMVKPQAYQTAADMGDLVDAIAEYDNSKYALGYSYFYYVNTMYKRDTIKMLSIDGIEPSVETIKDGRYPIYTNGFIVYDASKGEDSNTIKWVNNVLSDRGSKIIEDAGYVPVSDGNIDSNKSIIQARASSTLAPQGKFSYEASNVINGKKDNAWVEGVSGYGIGEYIEITQDTIGDCKYNSINIINGYAQDSTKWKNNSRVKKLKVYSNNEYITTIELADNMEVQSFDMTKYNLSAKKGEKAVFKFEIEDVYKGSKYDDTAITCIEISVK